MFHQYHSPADTVTPISIAVLEQTQSTDVLQPSTSSRSLSPKLGFSGKGKGKFEIRVSVMDVRTTSSSSSASTSSDSSSECYSLCHHWHVGLEHENEHNHNSSAFDIYDFPADNDEDNGDGNTTGIDKEEVKKGPRVGRDVEMKPTAQALELQRCREEMEITRQSMVKKYRSLSPRTWGTAARRLYKYIIGSRCPAILSEETNRRSRAFQLRMAAQQYKPSREHTLSERTQECKEFARRVSEVMMDIRMKTEEFEAVEKQLEETVQRFGDEEAEFELEEADEALFGVQVRSENILEELRMLFEERDGLLERQKFYTEY